MEAPFETYFFRSKDGLSTSKSSDVGFGGVYLTRPLDVLMYIKIVDFQLDSDGLSYRD